ncbi:MAG TPA: ATP-binding protein, partial [Xanthomonadaceae bacterium]|nr:ATP-binding protein [Xanthomonadaceae bacterium]
DAAGHLWVGTTAGLAWFDGDGFVPVALPGEDASPMIYSLTTVGPRVWVGTAAGAFHVELARGVAHVAAPAWSATFRHPNALVSLARDRDGWWVGSQRRLWRIRDDSDTPVPLPLGSDIGRPVRALLLQDDGALWTPVAGVGLGYLRSDWRRLAQLDRGQGLAGDLYQGIVPAAEGGFWIVGRPGVLQRIDAQGRVAPMSRRNRAALAGLRVKAVAEDGRGGLWLGAGRTLLHLDAAGQLRRWTPGAHADPTQQGVIDHLLASPDGASLWVAATGTGLQQRDLATGRVLRDFRAATQPVLGHGETEAMRFSHDGVLWVAGDYGLLRFDERRAAFVPAPGFAAWRVDGTGQGPRHVFGFDFAPDGSLWVHRLQGLSRYIRHGGRWQRDAGADAGSEDGIPAVESGGLRVDGAGHPWLATPRGLFRWDPVARLARRFGVGDGLSTQEVVARTLALDDRGVLAAALADGGVVLLDTAMASPLARAPPLRLDALSVRRAGGWHPLALAPGAELRPGDLELRVQARLLAFDDPSALRYWSWLQGVDDGWVAQGADGTRVFAGLPVGEHLLRVRARDGEGNAARERRLPLRVFPPWWRTGWAMAAWSLLAACAFVAVALAYRAVLARRNLLRMERHERAVAESASEAKSRFLATFGHEVRTPMTGVLGMSELLMGDTLDARHRRWAEAIHAAGRHLLRLVDDALDLAQIEAGRLSLHPAGFDLHAVIAEIDALHAPLATQRALGWSTSVDGGVPVRVVGDARRLRQVLHNLVGNAVKFTEAGRVALRATGGDGAVEFIVEDTGPGMDAAQQARLFRRFEQAEGARTATRFGGSGLGLAISQELVAAMGGTIRVDSVPGHGSRFVVRLPLRSEPGPLPVDAAAREDGAERRPVVGA